MMTPQETEFNVTYILACKEDRDFDYKKDRRAYNLKKASEFYAANPERVRARSSKWAKENPDRRREIRAKWQASNPEKRRAAVARRRANDPNYTRNIQLKHKYGLTQEGWNELFASQGNKCANCPAMEPGTKVGWCTDHCHATGKLRGILCHHCNVLLGAAKDNITTLRSAIAYLERHSNA